MIILKRQEVIIGLRVKIYQLSDDELVELYEKLYDITPIIGEQVNEEHIKKGIFDEMHLNCDVTLHHYGVDDKVEIQPHDDEEFANYWDVLYDSDAYWDKLEELEEKWSKEI